jgi:hypothetical protein
MHSTTAWSALRDRAFSRLVSYILMERYEPERIKALNLHESDGIVGF